MAKYILNKNKKDSKSGKSYEIHNEGDCNNLPDEENRIVLGYFSTCQNALAEAQRKYPRYGEDINGCRHCSNSCRKAA